MHVIDQYKKNYIEIDHKERMQKKSTLQKEIYGRKNEGEDHENSVWVE